MEEIKIWTHYDERTNTHEYAYAYIVDELPDEGDHVSFIYADEIATCVYPAWIDCEQPSGEVFKYDIYQVEIMDAENEEDIDWVYVAVKREEEIG